MRAVYKATDESRTVATASADSELSFVVEAGKSYNFRGQVAFVSGTVPDAKAGFVCVGATLAQGMVIMICTGDGQGVNPQANVYAKSNIQAGDAYAIVVANTNIHRLSFYGVVSASTGGSVAFTWAQYAATVGTPMTVKAGSVLLYEELPV